jgi:hypothetical protein
MWNRCILLWCPKRKMFFVSFLSHLQYPFHDNNIWHWIPTEASLLFLIIFANYFIRFLLYVDFDLCYFWLFVIQTHKRNPLKAKLYNYNLFHLFTHCFTFKHSNFGYLSDLLWLSEKVRRWPVCVCVCDASSLYLNCSLVSI